MHHIQDQEEGKIKEFMQDSLRLPSPPKAIHLGVKSRFGNFAKYFVEQHFKNFNIFLDSSWEKVWKGLHIKNIVECFKSVLHSNLCRFPEIWIFKKIYLFSVHCVQYHIEGNSAVFFIENPAAAEAISTLNKQITLHDGFKVLDW